MHKRWTKEEIEYLDDNWGLVSVRYIADNLCRSTNAVKSKAMKLNLGPVIQRGEFVGIVDFIGVSGIDRSTLMNWQENYNFPLKKKRFEKRYWLIIYPESFWKWAEINKNMIEWDKFEKYGLGAEPGWVEAARNAAFIRSRNAKKSMKKDAWSNAEVERLKWLLEKQRYTYPEISKELGRTHGAIKRKILDLGLKSRPVPLENSRKYSDEEIENIFTWYKQGHDFVEIGRRLNRSEAGVRGKVERLGYKFENRVLKKIGENHGEI